MSAEVFGDEPHRGFSTTTLLIAGLAGALLAGLLLYPWQQGVIDDRDRTIAAMAAAHESMQGQVDELRTQAGDLQDKVASFRNQARRTDDRLAAKQEALSAEREAHREAEARTRVMGGAPLEDGKHMAYVRDVQLGDPPFVTFDLLSVWRGKAAEEQANREGMVPDAEGIFVDNRSHGLRTMEVAPNAAIEINYWHRDEIKTGRPVSLETFANVMTGTEGWQAADQDSRYWLTVEGGRITAIHPYFTVIAC